MKKIARTLSKKEHIIYLANNKENENKKNKNWTIQFRFGIVDIASNDTRSTINVVTQIFRF